MMFLPIHPTVILIRFSKLNFIFFKHLYLIAQLVFMPSAIQVYLLGMHWLFWLIVETKCLNFTIKQWFVLGIVGTVLYLTPVYDQKCNLEQIANYDPQLPSAFKEKMIRTTW